MLVLSLALSLSCASHGPVTVPSPAGSGQRVTELADTYVKAWLEAFPENATYLTIPGARHDRLADNSLAALKAWQRVEDDLADRLAEVNAESLWATPEWVTHGFLREALEASRGLRACRNELWPVNQMIGWQNNLAVLAARQPVGAPDLRRQALARWRTLPRYLDTEVANLREGLRLGYSTPKRNVELVIEQLDRLLAAPVTGSPFFSPADRDGDLAFRREWEELVRDSLYPAVRRYRDNLKDEYLAEAREVQAVAANPDGERCYAASLRFYTTLDLPARELYDWGLRVIEQREERMQEIGIKVYGTGDLAEVRRRLREDKASRFTTRDGIVDYSTAAVERAKSAVGGWFSRLPKTDVVIEPQPEFQEKSGSSLYLPGAEDGSRPGTYLINLYRPEDQNRGQVETTAFHETWPGHHLQIALAQERPHAHPITRYLVSSGFAEGWARYAESLADEMGLYSSDLNRLYMISALPRGMVVDPGLHVLGWTREQAIQYTLSKQGGMSPEQAANYVDRIYVLPGQMATYGVGEQEIVALRERARQALGERFDLRELHDRVLENGIVTLGMLREVVERWIEEKTSSAARSPAESSGSPR